MPGPVLDEARKHSLPAGTGVGVQVFGGDWPEDEEAVAD